MEARGTIPPAGGDSHPLTSHGKATDPEIQANIRCNHPPWNVVGRKLTMCCPGKGQETVSEEAAFTLKWDRNNHVRDWKEEEYSRDAEGIEIERTRLQGSSRWAEGLKIGEQQGGGERVREASKRTFIRFLVFSQGFSSPGTQP